MEIAIAIVKVEEGVQIIEVVVVSTGGKSSSCGGGSIWSSCFKSWRKSQLKRQVVVYVDKICTEIVIIIIVIVYVIVTSCCYSDINIGCCCRCK